MKYIKYQHVEKIGYEQTEGLLDGECYVFPKLDGTNGKIWYEDKVIKFGNRNRELEVGKDNAGFLNRFKDDIRFKRFFEKYSDLILFGEYLVSHTIKHYRNEAWNKFYVFDVCKIIDNELVYLHFNEYEKRLKEFNIDYIPPICIVKNPTYKRLLSLIEKNTFLLQDGFIGEGIVVKNYQYKNKYEKVVWGKIVRNEFKEKHKEEFGILEIKEKLRIEEKIIEKYCSEHLINKTFEKIRNEKGWDSKCIPELLGRVFYDLINEDLYNIIKKYKFPKIDFNELKRLCILKIKEIKKDLF